MFECFHCGFENNFRGIKSGNKMLCLFLVSSLLAVVMTISTDAMGPSEVKCQDRRNSVSSIVSKFVRKFPHSPMIIRGEVIHTTQMIDLHHTEPEQPEQPLWSWGHFRTVCDHC